MKIKLITAILIADQNPALPHHNLKKDDVLSKPVWLCERLKELEVAVDADDSDDDTTNQGKTLLNGLILSLNNEEEETKGDRTLKCLNKNGINDLDELQAKTFIEIVEIKGITEATAIDIKELLHERGVGFKPAELNDDSDNDNDDTE